MVSTAVLEVAALTPDWESLPEIGKYDSMVRALRRHRQLNPGSTRIVETGTLRDDSEPFRAGDGWSTVAFGWYASQSGSTVVTVDVDPAAIDVSKRLTEPYRDSIEYVVSDSIAFLKSWDVEKRGRIHFLFLDSVDYVDHEASELQSLAEAQAALPSLAPKCLVLIDDTVCEEPRSAAAAHPPHRPLPPLSAASSLISRRGREHGERTQTAPAGESSTPNAESPTPDSEAPSPSPSPKGRGANPPPPTYWGKGARAVPFLVENGFTVEWAFEGQTLLSRGADSLPEEAFDTELTRRFRRRIVEDALAEELLLPPLAFVEADFQSFQNGNANHEFRQAIQSRCPQGGSACEIGSVSGYMPALLTQQNIESFGVAFDSRVCEHAAQINCRLRGHGEFRIGDPLKFASPVGERCSVIYHRDLLSTLPLRWVQSVLGQQVVAADHVVVTVPSAYSDADTAPSGAGRFLLTIDVWRDCLKDFALEEIRYIDQAAPGAQDRILMVLQGQEPSPRLTELATLPIEVYPFGISMIVPTLNEAVNIGPCIDSFEGAADEVFVVDTASQDSTVSAAREKGALVIEHPRVQGWDRVRMAAAFQCQYRFAGCIDGDERFFNGFGSELRQLLQREGHKFEALQVPFATWFAGRPMRAISPYKAPSIFKTGHFFYNSRPHHGARVDGRIAQYAQTSPERSLQHFSYDGHSHYLHKMDGYSSTLAAYMMQEGRRYSWRDMIAHAVRDMQMYYSGTKEDGAHLLQYALLSGFNRIVQHGKLFESRFKSNQIQPGSPETEIPASLEELFQFMQGVLREAVHLGRPPPYPLPTARSSLGRGATAPSQRRKPTANRAQVRPNT